MFRRVGCLTVLLLLFTHSAPAQDIQRGTIKKVDAEKKSITVTVGNKNSTFSISDETQISSAGGGEIKDGLKDSAFKVGNSVFFLAREQDGARGTSASGSQRARQCSGRQRGSESRQRHFARPHKKG